MTNQEIIISNAVGYSPKSIKNIINHYTVYKSLAQQANITALAIILDINRAFRRLNDREQTCIVYKIYGYTLRETAAKLNISYCAVNNTLNKACKKISTYLIGYRRQ